MRYRLLFRSIAAVLTVWITTAASPNSVQNESGQKSSSAERLGELISDCELRGLTKEKELTGRMLGLLTDRDPNRQYIFMPASDWYPGSDNFTPDPQWDMDIRRIRSEIAESLFQAACKVERDQAAARNWQQLHEVLFWNPDHNEARRITGFLGQPGDWRKGPGKIAARVSSRPYPLLNWQAGQWIQVETEHFSIASTATGEETIRIAELAERWRWVWQQTFFDFWNSAARLEKTIEGARPARNTREFSIVVFPNREAYVNELQHLVPGIDKSTGYYSDQQKLSFLFADEDITNQGVWRHELTHQFFQESVKARPGVFDSGFLWLCEGIAMYMESLQDHGDHITLGGFDASRLQFARTRRFREGFMIPIGDVNQMSRDQFQGNPALRNLYSQSAGVAQMMMIDGGGELRDRLITFLQTMYAGKVRADSFERIMGISPVQLDERYEAFLKTSPEEIERRILVPDSVTELSVSGVVMSQRAFESIGQCQNITWLDLTHSDLKAVGVGSLVACRKLKKIFLTSASIGSETLKDLRQLESLEELDLTASNVSDQLLVGLTGMENLRSLSLHRTAISDESIGVLVTLTALESIDLGETGISSAGISKLQQARPGLKIASSK